MAALAQARMPVEVRMKVIALPLAGSVAAYQGAMACIDTSDGTVKPGVAGSTTLIRVGEFEQSLDNSASTATAQVMVNLDKEIVGKFYDNATGAAAVVALFGSAYILDDHTVTVTSSGNSVAGRVWALDSVNGVLVETTNL